MVNREGLEAYLVTILTQETIMHSYTTGSPGSMISFITQGGCTSCTSLRTLILENYCPQSTLNLL